MKTSIASIFVLLLVGKSSQAETHPQKHSCAGFVIPDARKCSRNQRYTTNNLLYRTEADVTRKQHVLFVKNGVDNEKDPETSDLGRRNAFYRIGKSSLALMTLSTITKSPDVAVAIERKSTSDAEITDKIFLELKGLSSDPTASPARIVIGLFGKDAPNSVSILKQLVSAAGLPSKCKPLEQRSLQKEQLEANKVYNSCIESQRSGVTYDLSTVWRVSKNRRIDLGAVAGRFIAREFPTFQDDRDTLTHDAPGVVSVRRGNDGGFGFTIYPGGSDNDGVKSLNEENIVIGRVVEGMDIVSQLNELPVVQSSKVNYMGLTGGPTVKTAPSRSCFYGGPMYCNENKPLKKISIFATGIL